MERIQDRPQENSALTYYDDLGLPATASDEEIREAYHHLVRMLHPDLQRETSLKRFADHQMKRVSRAYAVLSDSDRRQRYNSELARRGETEPDARGAERTEGRSRARAWITLGWLVCAFAGAIGIGWYMSQESGAPPAPSEVRAAPDTRMAGAGIPPTPGAPASSANAPSSSPPAGTTGSTAPDSTPNGAGAPGSIESNPAESKPADSSSATANPASSNPPAADTAELESLRAELAAAKTERDRAREQINLQHKELDFLADRILAAPARAQKRFAGVWVAPKASPFSTNSSYAPYVADLIVTEDATALKGRYRARYPTMGRPEATVVRFYFEGKSDNDVANLTWKGDGGAKGDVQLRLVSPNSLELVWSATEMGKEAGPGSGTVLLVRRRD